MPLLGMSWILFLRGASLMLIHDTPKRLSIDIDMIINSRQTNLSDLFNTIIADTNLDLWEEKDMMVKVVVNLIKVRN
jgi:hypothetical protein